MKTALVLAGGGSRGAYEMGVWQALKEMCIRIDVVTGTSIGSMNAALVAQDAFDEAKHLWLTLDTDEVFDYKHVVENRGVRFTTVKDVMAEIISEDKLRNSPVKLGIVTVKYPSLEPVYYWAEDIPEGYILDYVFASCSCFPVVQPYEIDDEKYLDGGFTDTMPVGMALSQNPDLIIAVDLDGNGRYRKEDIEEAGDKLVVIKSSWSLGNFAIFDPSHAADIMRFGYLDALKAFGAFSGHKYTFFRGQFNLKYLNAIETAAENLGLDPKCIYTREIFLERAKDSIEKYYQDLSDAEQSIREFNPLKIDFHKMVDNKKGSKEEDIFEFGEKAELIALARYMKKNPDGKLPRAMKKVLTKKMAAASWLVSEGLV